MKREKKIRPDGDSYLYLASRLNALETGMPDAGQMRRFTEAKSRYELHRMLAETGIVDQNFNGAGDELDAFLPRTYAFIAKNVPDPELFSLFRLPYDCHNLKAAVKSALLSGGADFEENARRLSLDCGTVSPEAGIKAVKTRDPSALPEHLGKAVLDALDRYAMDRDPRRVDMILDRACFADMSEQVGRYRCPFFEKLLRVKADTLNFLTCLRLIRMGEGKEALAEAYLPGGSIGEDELAPCVKSGAEEGTAALFEKLSSRGYSDLIAGLGTDLPLGRIEKAVDEYYLKIAKEGKEVFDGPERVAWHLILCENTVRNLRVIVSGNNAGLDAETIRERLREAYV